MDNDSKGSNLLIVNEHTSDGLSPPKRNLEQNSQSISSHIQKTGVVRMSIYGAVTHLDTDVRHQVKL